MTLNAENAQNIAIAALNWLAGDPEKMAHFMNFSGANPDNIRENAMEPTFLAGILGFILMDDDSVIDCAAAQNIPPENIRNAQFVLSGGGVEFWT